MTRQETVLSLTVHIPIIPGVWGFSAFRGICRALGEGHGRKKGFQEADCMGTILSLPPAIIDLWATYKERDILGGNL